MPTGAQYGLRNFKDFSHLFSEEAIDFRFYSSCKSVSVSSRYPVWTSDDTHAVLSEVVYMVSLCKFWCSILKYATTSSSDVILNSSFTVIFLLHVLQLPAPMTNYKTPLVCYDTKEVWYRWAVSSVFHFDSLVINHSLPSVKSVIISAWIFISS